MMIGYLYKVDFTKTTDGLYMTISNPVGQSTGPKLLNSELLEEIITQGFPFCTEGCLELLPDSKITTEFKEVQSVLLNGDDCTASSKLIAEFVKYYGELISPENLKVRKKYIVLIQDTPVVVDVMNTSGMEYINDIQAYYLGDT